MLFEKELRPDIAVVYSYMGYAPAAQPDEATARAAANAAAHAAAATRAKWCARRFALQAMAGGIGLAGTGTVLEGENIAAHLAGCDACFLLAVTLGAGVDAALRAASAGDIRDALLLDTAASVLVEQYADEAEALAKTQYMGQSLYATGRFSPGYGDLPLALQGEVVALLDAARGIGLSVSDSGILVPRKSITAIIGLANSPVKGALAGCATCALAATCNKDKPCATEQKEKPC